MVGRLFGLRKADMPRTLADLDDYRRAMLAGDRLHVTPWARERARAIVLEPPVPLYLQPLVETVNFVTIALLPGPHPGRVRLRAAAAALSCARRWCARAPSTSGARWCRSCRSGCGWFRQHALLRLHRDQAGGQGLEPR